MALENVIRGFAKATGRKIASNGAAQKGIHGIAERLARFAETRASRQASFFHTWTEADLYEALTENIRNAGSLYKSMRSERELLKKGFSDPKVSETWFNAIKSRQPWLGVDDQFYNELSQKFGDDLDKHKNAVIDYYYKYKLRNSQYKTGLAEAIGTALGNVANIAKERIWSNELTFGRNIARLGATLGVYEAAMVGARYLAGGTFAYNAEGEPDIAGIPLI